MYIADKEEGTSTDCDDTRRVLYLCSSGAMGGAETSLYNVVRSLDRDRYIPFVLCPEPGLLVEKLVAEQIPTEVIFLPGWRKLKSRLSRFTALHRMASFVELNLIQLIHSNTIWVNPYAQRVGEKLRIPVICHLPEGGYRKIVDSLIDKINHKFYYTDVGNSPISNESLASLSNLIKEVYSKDLVVIPKIENNKRYCG